VAHCSPVNPNLQSQVPFNKQFPPFAHVKQSPALHPISIIKWFHFKF
jgi:hypothetical protein